MLFWGGVTSAENSGVKTPVIISFVACIWNKWKQKHVQNKQTIIISTRRTGMNIRKTKKVNIVNKNHRHFFDQRSTSNLAVYKSFCIFTLNLPFLDTTIPSSAFNPIWPIVLPRKQHANFHTSLLLCHAGFQGLHQLPDSLPPEFTKKLIFLKNIFISVDILNLFPSIKKGWNIQIIQLGSCWRCSNSNPIYPTLPNLQLNIPGHPNQQTVQAASWRPLKRASKRGSRAYSTWKVSRPSLGFASSATKHLGVS